MNKREIANKVIDAYGDVNATVARFGYAHTMGVYNWRIRGVPKKHYMEIFRDTGLDLVTLNKRVA